MIQLQAQLGAAEARATHWQQVATRVLTPNHKKNNDDGRADGGEGAGEGEGEGERGEDGVSICLLEGRPDSTDPDGLFASTPPGVPRPAVDPAAKDAILEATLQENTRLNGVVASLQEGLKDSQAQLLASQASMQKEFASLWSAVQELNKLDTIKEHHLSEVLSAKEVATTRLGRAVGRCEELEREIVAMDRVLEEAVQAEEGRGRATNLIASSTFYSPKRASSSVAGSTNFPPVSPASYRLPLPPPGTDPSDLTPHRSGWKAATPSSASRRGGTPTRPSSSPRMGLSRMPGEEMDASALDRQLSLLSKFLVNDKSALRIQKLREKTLSTPKT